MCMHTVACVSVLRWQIPSVNHFRSIYSEACVQRTPAQHCQRSATVSATLFAALTPPPPPPPNAGVYPCEHEYLCATIHAVSLFVSSGFQCLFM